MPSDTLQWGRLKKWNAPPADRQVIWSMYLTQRVSHKSDKNQWFAADYWGQQSGETYHGEDPDQQET